ncbi:KGGVGR-motif variant AAA ATPase [Fibrobacter sp. UWB5]|uniref:tyrosine-protein kinase family protein n=1 Tax=Fibrobacter sp. UWB5 TaxID=1964360 RepID=UPI000B528B25|nr:AAA family ATPase [Fibrobacter sp. UWB5]OWV13948.1 hypothetical protein B7989_00280 [Fibrobacter sp. UWB5]
MILITTYAKELEKFLTKKQDSREVRKFKIFVRIGFQLDVYVFTEDCESLQNIEAEFFDYISKTGYAVNQNKLRIYFNILPLSELDDSYYSKMVEGSESIDYGPRYRFDSFLGKKQYEIADASEFPPVITFYSYKGGVGRTTAMISYALHLAADKGKKVAIIDCDLEAPGYLNFFNLSEHPELKDGKKNGLVEFLCDTQFVDKSIDINNYILNIGVDRKLSKQHPELENIWLMPAGNLNDGTNDGVFSQSRRDYLEGLAKLNLGNTKNVVQGFNNLFGYLKNLNIDVILVDSRTGFNDIFGNAILYLSTCVVGLFGYSRQTEPGFMNLVNIHSALLKADENKNDKHNGQSFKLILAYSILPNNEKDRIPPQMSDFINRSYENIFPAQYFIHRNPILESIGTGDAEIDDQFIKMNTSEFDKDRFVDYTKLFEGIDDYCFSESQDDYDEGVSECSTKKLIISAEEISDLTSKIDLKNIILYHLKNELEHTGKQSGKDELIERGFLYRECMKKVFNKNYFIIEGMKGSGKTYLCKALQNKNILNKIKECADGEQDVQYTSICVMDGNDKIIFSGLLGETLDKYSPNNMSNYEHYFNHFWHIFTWNKLLYDDGNENLAAIRHKVITNSVLTNIGIEPFGGKVDKNKYIHYLNEIVKKDALYYIKEDIKNFNKELKQQSKKIILLYDQIDSKLPYWKYIANCLIKSYSVKSMRYSNILPKFFICAGTLAQAKGKENNRFSGNIINIEWSIEETFGLLFKIIFSDECASKAFRSMAIKQGIDFNNIDALKNDFLIPQRQLKCLSRASLEQLVQVFFGKYVNQLGKPWDYFKKMLSNADNNSVNLSYFINILKDNAIEQALKSERYIKEVISPSVYTSNEILKKAAGRYFKNLASDKSNEILLKFKETVLHTPRFVFCYKSMESTLFNLLIEETLEKNKESLLSPSVYRASFEKLRRLIIGQGIMAEKFTNKGLFYVFAPIYWSLWHLQNGALDDGFYFIDNKMYIELLNKSIERNRQLKRNCKKELQMLAKLRKRKYLFSVTGTC